MTPVETGQHAGGEAPRYDLHLHTHYSYDALTPASDVLDAAAAMGLRVVAVTDHHVIDGLPEVMATARRHPELRVIPAAELTVHCSIGSVDLLCYGLPISPTPELRPVLDAYHEWQRAYGAAQVAGMRKLGYDYTDEHRRQILGGYRPARILETQGWTHVRNGVLRAYFMERGFIQREEDYAPLLRQAAKAHPFPLYPSASSVVPAAKQAGATVVIAHPSAYFGEGLTRADSLREELQFDGVECAHPSISKELSPLLREYCVRHRLVSTAGSDCHTPEDLGAKLGRHGGAREWLEEFLERVDRVGK